MADFRRCLRTRRLIDCAVSDALCRQKVRPVDPSVVISILVTAVITVGLSIAAIKYLDRLRKRDAKSEAAQILSTTLSAGGDGGH